VAVDSDQEKLAQELQPPGWLRWIRRIVGGLLLLVLAAVLTIILVIIAVTQGWDAEKKEGLQRLKAIGQRFEADPLWTEIHHKVLWEHDCGEWTSSPDCNSLYQSWDTGSPYRAGFFAEVIGRLDVPLTLVTGPEGLCNKRDAADRPMHGCSAGSVIDDFQVSVGVRDTGEDTNAIIHLRVEE
jgi:hypothetical protein